MYWADLHNHNNVGYGKGSLERSYALAENSLDVYAFSPHGFWPDPPASDPKMAQYHLDTFERVKVEFPRVIEMANARYRPGKFVTFIAYEWHSVAWGDFVILFPGDAGELFRARDLDELKSFARRTGALLIPHHVAYRHGWRGLDWSALDPHVSPLAEVFSEHGNSLERDGLHAMLAHSLGGAHRSQTAMEQIRRGLHVGFTAGTDDHYGYPACYGEGITGIAATELTRESVFDALRRRHTLVATGDRIEMDLRCESAAMGDVAPAGASRRFDIQVDPLDRLEFVQILRNGEVAAMWPGPPASRTAKAGRHLVRMEWGWGRMGHSELTDWEIDIEISGGALAKVIPCFCGGAGSTERVNRADVASPARARIRCFTSRLNTLPVSGAVLVFDGDAATRLKFRAAVDTEGERGECRLETDLAALAEDDAWCMPLERISSPRLRVGSSRRAEEMAFRGQWQDPSSSGRATYMLKAQQANGQCAWTSPILCE